MGKIEFTGEQKTIIDADISDVLVSAAAGSGKTTVLVERIIREISEGKLSIDRLLVVTFTNDAADNMANKIEDSLKEKITKARDSGDLELAGRLAEQLDLLPNAYIQTIDSFCSRVIKEKGYLIKVPEDMDVFAPGNVILDECNLVLILDQAVSLAVDEMFTQASGEDDPFIKLTNRFGNGRTDDSLIASVTEIYKKLRSLPDYIAKIEEFTAERRANDQAEKIRAIEYLLEMVAGSFRKIRGQFEDAKDYCFRTGRLPVPASVKKNREEACEHAFDAFEEYVDSVLDAYDDPGLTEREKYEAVRNIDPVAEVLSAKFLGGLQKMDHSDPDDVEFAYNLSCFGVVLDLTGRLLKERKCSVPLNFARYAGANRLPESFKNIIARSFDEHLEDTRINTEIITAYTELIKKCDRNYARLKASVHGADFADQEFGALSILKGEDSDARDYYRDKFIEIYIDEYQDNSPLQDKIITSFDRSENGGNVFRVGDVKQSIYKFRNADPYMFMDRQDDKTQLTRYITQNHRSSRQILDFVNFIFTQVMTKDAAEVEYDENQLLNPSDEAKDSNIPRVVICDLSAKFWDTYDSDGVRSDTEEDDEQEAAPAVKRNKEGNIDSKVLSARLKPALCFGVLKEVRRYINELSYKPEDICILAKKSDQCKYIADFLRKNGIKAQADDRTRIFEDLDIQSVIHLIILMGNEYRDEYLMSVMLRNFRFSNFTLDDLAGVNAYFKVSDPGYLSLNLMTRLRKFCEEDEESDLAKRLAHFIDVFDDLRMTSRVGDIDDLIDEIYMTSGIMANVKTDDNLGAKKLILLKDWLTDNFKRYGTDIGTIASKLEDMKIKINRNALFGAKDYSEQAVRCMTIHKSKGLEFPCVILAFDDSQEGADRSGTVVFDRDYGLIADDFDESALRTMTSLEKSINAVKNKKANNAETLRLLYVALTRAKSELSIVTGVDYEAGGGVSFAKNSIEGAMANEDITFGLGHWLQGNAKIGYAVMSAVIRASCASGLRKCLGINEAMMKRVIPYDGFEFCPLTDDGLIELSKVAGENTEVSVEEPVDSVSAVDHGAYKHEKVITIPFKVAVTGINDWNISTTTHVDMKVKDKEEYLDKFSGRVTASGKGTIVHLIMQWADPAVYKDGVEGLMSEVGRLIEEGVFDRYQPDDIRLVAEEFADGIMAFAGSSVGIKMAQASEQGRAEFEKPVVFAVPAYEGAPSEDFVLVQGIIDAIFYEDDGAVIVDYKTDDYGPVTDEEIIKNARERHSFQISCYAASCEASDIPVKSRYLYLVRYSRLVEI